MTKRLILSTVIVNYNTKNLLKQCLNSLIENPTKSSEIIVVDNASTDGSVEMVRKRFPQVKTVANESNCGFGAANNQGAKIAKGKYLLFLNPDTRIERGLDELLEYMEKNPKVGVLGCRLVDESGQEQPHIAGFKHNVFGAVMDKFHHVSFVILRNLERSRKGPKNPSVYLRQARQLRGQAQRSFANAQDDESSITKVDWVTGACLLIRRKVFDELKGFDERFFMYFEDEDLCLRAKERGWRVIYYPRFSIVHVGGASLGKNKKSRYDYYFQSQDLFYKKHHKIWQRLLLKVMRYPFRVFFQKKSVK